MTAIFISFDQAHHERIVETLDRMNCRGFTYWPEVQGRGTATGEPHYGSHAWPSMNSAIFTVVESDERANRLLDRLAELDRETPRLGLRAFSWHIDRTI